MGLAEMYLVADTDTSCQDWVVSRLPSHVVENTFSNCLVNKGLLSVVVSQHRAGRWGDQCGEGAGGLGGEWSPSLSAQCGLSCAAGPQRAGAAGAPVHFWGQAGWG